MRRVFVVGVGMSKFIKPGREGNPDYTEMGKQAVNRALRDLGLPYSMAQQAVVGYVYGESCAGQRTLYEVGQTGIPIYNVNNNCSTGSTAIHICHRAIAGGFVDLALALGFEKMKKGSLGKVYSDRADPLGPWDLKTEAINGRRDTKSPFAAQYFGNGGIEHMKKYGTTKEHMAKIAYKNHLHSSNNPYSQFREIYTLDDIKNSPIVYGPLTKLQCCPTSDGAAAAFLCSEKFMLEHGLQDQAVEILGISLKTDYVSTFGEDSFMKLIGRDLSKKAAEDVYKQSGVKPSEIGVCELHDCFSANELVSYAAIQLCEEGKEAEFIDKGLNTYGGRVVVNPSGGLISKGHPLGATGLAQCSELSWQLRGMAMKRQVPNVRFALQHNIGLGGACVMMVYKKYNEHQGWKRPDQTSDPDVLEKIEAKEEEVVKRNNAREGCSHE